MQTLSGSIAARPYPQGERLFSRVLRLFTHRERIEERPATRWAEMRAVDFEGEDTSLTQAHLEVLR